MKKNSRFKKAFTLLELIVVIAIIAILSTVVAITTVFILNKKRVEAAKIDVSKNFSSVRESLISSGPGLSENDFKTNGEYDHIKVQDKLGLVPGGNINIIKIEITPNKKQLKLTIISSVKDKGAPITVSEVINIGAKSRRIKNNLYIKYIDKKFIMSETL